MDTKQKLTLSKAAMLPDPSLYRRLAGRLVYHTVTRPDISFPVHVLSQFMDSPTYDHINAAIKVLGYLKEAQAQGLLYPNNNLSI